MIAMLLALAAGDVPATPAGREALAVLQRAVAIPTVEGRGEVPKLAAFVQDHLAEAGLPRADMRFVPLGETGYLTVRYRGRDAKAKPLVLLVHMDVVEARRADWKRDPFVPVVENGWVYGRGALDDKSGLAIAVATLATLKRAGWMPARDVVLLATGDEETAMVTTAKAAAELKDALLVLNGDAGGGMLGPDGKPLFFALQAAEKTYADVTLTVTDPGGHSSRPGASNAIARMAQAIGRVAAYRFPAQQNEITKAYFAATAKLTPGPLGVAMAAFARDPGDAAAVATLSADPETIGQVRTTCVPTLIEGGHAPNALPQKVTANVNCRIFPGVSAEAVRAGLERVVADTGVAVTMRRDEINEAPASPLKPEVVAAVTEAVHRTHPGLAVIPAMEAGATDSTAFRKYGIPAYGVLGVFLKPTDMLAHGLDERLPVASLDTGTTQWESLIRDLAGR